MECTRLIATLVAMLTFAALGCGPSATPQSREPGAVMDVTAIAIPQSIQVEHEAIHSTLVEATQAPGQVGVAAKELAAVLHPHFVREEQIALPPLGFLGPLAAGTTVSEDVLTSVLHAQTEEEVLYPTALLVGDLIRARGQGR